MSKFIQTTVRAKNKVGLILVAILAGMILMASGASSPRNGHALPVQTLAQAEQITDDVGVGFTLTGTQLGVTATTQFTDVVEGGYAPNGDPGDFEIQGNVIATAGGGHTDWVANGVGTTGLLTNAGVPLDSSVTSRRLDGYGGSGDDVFAGSSKTSDNPNTYTWKTAGANNKCDMNNSYVHISKDGNNDRWITASADRSSNNGTAYVDFELSQATLSQVTDAGCSSAPCGHFETSPAGKNPGDPLYATGGRTPNDLMVTAQYNSGGALASILIYQWKAVSGTYQWVDVTSSIPNNAAFVATNVVDGVAVPYGAFSATSYSKNQFVETSVNLTKLIAAAVDPCLGIEVKTVFVKTKTSTAATATLEDFVTPISVSFSAGFMVDLAQSPVSCFGGSNGSVTVTVSGGTAPYMVTLGGVTQTIVNSGGSTTFTGLTAGSKSVHVVATGGCSRDGTIEVTQPAGALSASISSQTNVACFGASTGSVTVAGSGGTSPYTYSIDGTNFGGSGTFNNLAAGSYTVTVKDANGCTTAQPVTITQPAAALSASISSQTNVACFGASSGSVTVAGSGGTSPYTYSIDGTNFGGSGTFNNLAAGSYTVTVKDANGCTTGQPVTITQPASVLSASISAQTNVACFGASTGSVTAAGSGGTSPYTYSIDGTNFGGGGTFNNLAAGSYTVTVKDANGCTTAQPVTITQPAGALSASISSQTNVACFGASTGSVTVAGSGGTSPYTYSIDGVHFGGSGTFNNLVAGSYTVTVKDANGCTTAQPVTITQPAAALSASISSQTNVACFGASTGSVTVAGSGGTSPYTYSIDGTNFGGSGTFNNLAAGSYTVTVKDANGCTTGQPVTITQPASALSASISAQTNVACFGASTGSVTVAGSGGTSPYTYSIDGVHFGGSGTFNNLTAGSYTVTVKDANGCTTGQPVTITQPASALSASISSQTNVACFGASTGSVTVAGSGGTSPYTYSIDGTNFGGSGTFNNLVAGSYTVTAKDANGCTTGQPVTITQPASALSASISAQTNVACFGASTGSVTVAGSGGTSPYTYSIDGTNFGGSGTFNNLAAGSYTVTAKDANGCTTAQPVTITQPASALSASISAQTNVACFGASTGSVTVAGSGGTSPYTYSIDGVHFGGSGTFNNLTAGSYTVTVKDANGCTTAQPVTITQPASALSASISAQTNVACFGASTGSVTVAGSGGTSPYTYSIDGTNFGGSGTFNNLAAGSYTVTVKDANGCTTAQPVTITQPAAALSTTSTETDPICSTGLGSMTVTFSGGTPGYQCKIDSGLFTACTSPATFNNLSAGSHTVSVRDSKGCLGPEQIKTVTIPPAITASATGSGCSPGTITVTASGGTGTLTYSLDGISFQGSNVFSDLAAGQYVVTVKDANGCTKITNTVTIRGSITITANARTKTYGTSLTLGTTEFAVTGSLAPGEHITSVTLTSLTGAAGNASMPVGTYTNEIVPSNATGTGGFLASNYCITYNTGTLTVNKAVLTVKADDKFKVYDGAPFTAFTSKITGFVNGETEAGLRSSGGLSGAPDYVGSAIGAINPASYTITPVIGTLAATNYSFIFVDGILTILPAVVTSPVEIRLASVSPKTIRKGGTSVFTITMSHGPLPGPLTVNYVMSGNGTMGVHYTLSGTLGQAIIPAGSSLGTVTLTALPTNLTSGSEKVTMTLIPGAGYSVVNNKKSKTVTIKNK